MEKEQKGENKLLLYIVGAQLLNIIIPTAGLIATLIIWLIKREESEKINEQGKSSLNFQITILIFSAISGLLSLILIGYLFLLVIIVCTVVFSIIAASENMNEKIYIYPLSLRFIK
ncbi:MAG: DUF4870 domain-containing protein [Spirochaetales bacterium]|nr:DUF4870 domain-containing protein [Spirochaetales bacterium]